MQNMWSGEWLCNGFRLESMITLHLLREEKLTLSYNYKDEGVLDVMILHISSVGN